MVKRQGVPAVDLWWWLLLLLFAFFVNNTTFYFYLYIFSRDWNSLLHRSLFKELIELMGFLILILASCAGLSFIERVNFKQRRPIESTFNLSFETLRAFWSHGTAKSCSIHKSCHCFEGWIMMTRWLACWCCLQCLWEHLLFLIFKSPKNRQSL